VPRKVKYLDKHYLQIINRISDKVQKYNRTLPDKLIDALPDDKFFPITFTMMHEHRAGVAGPDPDADRRIYVVYGLKDPASKPAPAPGEPTAAFDAKFKAWAAGITADDMDLIAIWNRCAHLGCPVAYSPGSAGYVCPCHGGNYDSRGLVTGGPPPRPLDRVDIKVVDTSKTFTADQIAKGEDRVPLGVAAKSNNPNLRVLVGKPYSIDEQQQATELVGPGEPVSGTLANLYPFH
jgi:nitrite reductase/ring-hydroxylating ferredoxin subunit